MKIQTLRSEVFGTQISLPDLGMVKISKTGEVEVPDEIGVLLLQNSPNWKVVGKSKEEKPEIKVKTQEDKAVSQEVPEGTTQESKEPEKSQEIASTEPTITKESLNAFEVDELKEMALEIGISEEKIEACKDKKPLLISAILKANK
jgi:predicted DNA binding CopG/RHH family protein